MNTNSTFVYILAGIVALHFLVGMGYLLYKFGSPSKTKEKKEGDCK